MKSEFFFWPLKSVADDSPTMSSPTPAAGFVVKVVPGGEKHFVNVCSHDAVDRPLDASDREVGDAHLSELGVDNLRVPLLCGPVRTFVGVLAVVRAGLQVLADVITVGRFIPRGYIAAADASPGMWSRL